MTRTIHDQFAKDYLEQILSPYGQVQAPRRVPGEAREIDVWFAPRQLPDVASLGLLARITRTTTILEPFRNPVTPEEVSDCLLKQLEVGGQLRREGKRQGQTPPQDFPFLWILTPTASARVLSGFGANMKRNWGQGIYFLAPLLRTRIMVIHQLPRTPETLWLRVLGKGKVQEQAVDELEALPPTHPWRSHILELLYQLQENLKDNQQPDPDLDDRELIMRLKPLFTERLAEAEQQGIQQGMQQGMQQGIQQGMQQGIQQGELRLRHLIEGLLRERFGLLDVELTAIIEPLLSLPLEELTPLILRVSREDLIARFRSPN